PAELEHFPDEWSLQRGFASRERDAAVGVRKEEAVFLYFFHDIFDRIELPCHLQRAVWANRHASETQRAFIPINDAFSLFLSNGAACANRETAETSVAPMIRNHEFLNAADSFWIAAPPTPQRATLQKNRCPNAWPVMKRISLDMENKSLDICHLQPRDLMIHALALHGCRKPWLVLLMISS
ncbi:MAG: hypothetical protein RBT20_05575, partial [Syntrophales bacterium]|nr:hypothetical protein [Syntrophales bacterium]